jgi:hypothetical protein
MAQTGFTPISLYYTATAAATPTAGNLVAGELALNNNDGKLFYKDSNGVVQTIASKAGNSGSFTNLAYTGTFTGGTGVIAIGTNQIYKDANGYIGIGTTSPSTYAAFAVRKGITGQGVSNASAQFSDAVNSALWVGHTSGCANLVTESSNITLGFTNGFATSEKMRVDSSGNLLVGTTDANNSSGVGVKFVTSTVAESYVSTVNNSASSSVNNYLIYNTNATNNGYRFYVNLNGGIYNYSGNNSNLSDERTKENIELASNYLNKICAIPIKTFNYKDEPTGEQKTLGVIAQDVEIVAPELVNNEGFGETKKGEQPLKSIYTTDIMFAMMKAIQELNAKVDAQAATITALQAKVA